MKYLLLLICFNVFAQERSASIVLHQTPHHFKKTDRRFLSFAIDTAQVVGIKFWRAKKQASFDFSDSRLRYYSKFLSPAILRVGGTDADRVFYQMNPSQTLPGDYLYPFSVSHWDGLYSFAQDLSFDVMFTVNAGPGPRERKEWKSDNFESLLQYVSSKKHHVAYWELGNEINYYFMEHGISHVLSGSQYSRDFERFHKTVDGFFPRSKVVGPSSMYVPVLGEPLSFLFGEMKSFLKHSFENKFNTPDVVTWHYYPQQSERCGWMRTRAATPTLMLDPEKLDDVGRWADEVNYLAKRYSQKSSVWLGETGNAQCGGMPGVSDTFAGSLWWLDELGLMATKGQEVVIRQTLVGSDYGLIDDQTYLPRPDYWASLMWKYFMGEQPLLISSSDKKLRVYAHCSKRAPENVVFLLINIGSEAVMVRSGLSGKIARITAQDLFGKRIKINDTSISEDTKVEDFFGVLEGMPAAKESFLMESTSYAFVVGDKKHSALCSSR